MVRVDKHTLTVSKIYHKLSTGSGGLNKAVGGGQRVLTISIVNEAGQSLTTGAPGETLQEQRR